MLEREKLWFHNPSTTRGLHEQEKYLSFVQLDPTINARFVDGSTDTFTLSSFKTNSQDIVILRSKSAFDAACWVTAINNRNAKVDDKENQSFVESESSVSSNQQFASKREFMTLENNVLFEGMIGNPVLRNNFRRFLSINYAEESLQFWECAEDFWRNHPSVIADCAEENGARFVENKKLAEKIYDIFIRPGSSKEISCSSQDRDVIRTLLHATENKCSRDIFVRVQASVFDRLRFMYYYEYLVERPGYRKILIANIHASSRVSSLYMSCQCHRIPLFFVLFLIITRTRTIESLRISVNISARRSGFISRTLCC